MLFICGIHNKISIGTEYKFSLNLPDKFNIRYQSIQCNK